MTSATPRATLAPSVADATVITPVSVGPRHGVHPSANTAPSSGAPPIVDSCRGREPGLTLQRRDEADEHQAHHDRDHPADALQQKLIGDQRGRHAEHRDGAEHEHRGEPGDEQRRSPGDPQPRRPHRRPDRRRPPRHRRPRPGRTGSPAPAAPRTARRTRPARPARTRPAPATAARRRRFRRSRSFPRSANRCTTGCRSSASSSRRNTAATRCWRSSTTVDGMTVVGYLPPNAIMVRIAGS